MLRQSRRYGGSRRSTWRKVTGCSGEGEMAIDKSTAGDNALGVGATIEAASHGRTERIICGHDHWDGGVLLFGLSRTMSLWLGSTSRRR